MANSALSWTRRTRCRIERRSVFLERATAMLKLRRPFTDDGVADVVRLAMFGLVQTPGRRSQRTSGHKPFIAVHRRFNKCLCRNDFCAYPCMVAHSRFCPYIYANLRIKYRHRQRTAITPDFA